jgi:PAS domain S-box-containing protein
VVTVNTAQERISRTPRTVSLGRVFWEVWPEVQGTRYVEEYRRCMEQRITVHFEEHDAALDVWTDVTAHPTHGGGIVAFLRDVTAEKRAGEALARETEKYRSLFQNSLDAVYLARADGTILEANPAACRLHGMTMEEIERAGRNGLVATDARLAAALSARERAGRIRAELTVRRKDGTTVPVELESVLLDGARPDSAAFVISRTSPHGSAPRRRCATANASRGSNPGARDALRLRGGRRRRVRRERPDRPDERRWCRHLRNPQGSDR